MLLRTEKMNHKLRRGILQARRTGMSGARGRARRGAIVVGKPADDVRQIVVDGVVGALQASKQATVFSSVQFSRGRLSADCLLETGAQSYTDLSPLSSRRS